MRRRWTNEDDGKLCVLFCRYGNKWKTILEKIKIPDVNEHRLKRRLNAIRRRSENEWTDDDIALLAYGCKKYGDAWETISSSVFNFAKTPEQLYEKSKEFLKAVPSVSSVSPTESEEPVSPDDSKEFARETRSAKKIRLEREKFEDEVLDIIMKM